MSLPVHDRLRGRLGNCEAGPWMAAHFRSIDFSNPARVIMTDIRFARAFIYSAATEDSFPARSFSFFCLRAKKIRSGNMGRLFIRTPVASSVSYTHLRAHETRHDLVCRLLLE